MQYYYFAKVLSNRYIIFINLKSVPTSQNSYADEILENLNESICEDVICELHYLYVFFLKYIILLSYRNE